jgi:hypothetical protein
MISLMPILSSVGRYTGVSTFNGKNNHFYKLVTDLYDSAK